MKLYYAHTFFPFLDIHCVDSSEAEAIRKVYEKFQEIYIAKTPSEKEFKEWKSLEILKGNNGDGVEVIEVEAGIAWVE